MPSWKGQSKGNIIGYKIFVFTLEKLGISFAYFLLSIVAFYYFLFVPKAVKHTYSFYKKRLGFSRCKSILATYRNFFNLGKIIIDKVAILGKLRKKYTFDFDGENHLRQMVRERKGGILINAHVGNFEIAGQLLERLETKFNVLMFDAEHQQIKKYLSDVMEKKNFNIIAIKDDFSHALKIAEAFENNEIMAMGGDRYIEETSTILVDFFGGKAKFPAGPFLMAAKFQVPVTFAFAFKETKFHYHFYATPLISIKKIFNKEDQNIEIQNWVQEFAKEIERLIRRYPYQWFNYYNFWESESS